MGILDFIKKREKKLDSDGYDSNGYNRLGYNRLGLDVDGFNIDGFDKDGYNREGFDTDGYNREGYDGEGYNRSGFNKDGYNRDGFDPLGYDRAGYDIFGYDKNGFDRNGRDKDGFDRDGFDSTGYNRAGFDRDGYNKTGYDCEGYDRKGFNKDGLSRAGFPERDYLSDGFHKDTGYDAFGYDRMGYNANGINRNTKRDRFGFDANGIDEAGYTIWGINPQTGNTVDGGNIESLSEACDLTEESCQHFEELYYRFMFGKEDAVAPLADCYASGTGTIKDIEKAVSVFLTAAIDFNNCEALKLLSDCYLQGKYVECNPAIAAFLKEKTLGAADNSFYEYKAGQAIKFTRIKNEKKVAFDEENQHLACVQSEISQSICAEQNAIVHQSNETWWMDEDQRKNWLQINSENELHEAKIAEYKSIKSKPYYARLDVSSGTGSEKYYIGEHQYHAKDTQAEVYSVWSNVGRAYRNTLNTNLMIGSEHKSVALRRRIDINNGRLVDIFDEYAKNSKASNAQITDPYLLRILEQKHSEPNITNIISSIQSNQNEIIEEDIRTNIIVQGCAGSGKTMILLHRLANLKYNNPKLDWEQVKIITPNSNFSLYIDELSKDLQISSISRLTLHEYYLNILENYSGKVSSNHSKSELSDGLRKSFRRNAEKTRLRGDNECGIEFACFVYSDRFKTEYERRIENWKEKNNLVGFDDAIRCFDEVFHQILTDNNLKDIPSASNYLCVLYAKVLLMYTVFGAPNKVDTMLCIDEGQDICEAQYTLLLNVNRKAESRTGVCLNVFGDLSQRIKENVSVTSWDTLQKQIGAKYYTLNENYRNSEEIISFYNHTLNKSNTAFGLKVKSVEHFSEKGFGNLVKLQLLLGNRTVIITKDVSNIPSSILQLVNMPPHKGKIEVMGVRQVKGLEYDTAFVFDEDMDENEKYISYTRALSELYVHNDDLDGILFGIPNEVDAVLDVKSLLEPLKEKVSFDRESAVLDEENVYITLYEAYKTEHGFAIVLALRTSSSQGLEIFGENIVVNDIFVKTRAKAFVLTPSADEQLIAFYLATDELPVGAKSIRDIESYGLQIVVEMPDRRKIESGYFYADIWGSLIFNEDEQLEENEIMNDDIEIDVRPKSIRQIIQNQEHALPIIVREKWTNDFCFAVAYVIGETAYGTEYLNGAKYKETAFNISKEEWRLYTGPSVRSICEQEKQSASKEPVHYIL